MYYLRNYLVTFLLAIFCSIPLVEKLYNKIKKIAFVNLFDFGRDSDCFYCLFGGCYL